MPWLALLLQIEPMIPGLVADFRALFAKHPALADPAAQAAFIAALAAAAASTDDKTLALIAADQAAHSVA
jgi:2-hydroxychromene-2-carboxylate isomerase